MAIHLTPALEGDLNHLAAESNSTVDELAQRALEDFVAYRRELNDAVMRGDEDIAAGRLLEHQEVVSRMDGLMSSRETFPAAVREGIAAGERGELVEHDEIVAMLDDIIAHG